MKKIVLANWKMHFGPVQAGAWIRAFRRERLPKEADIGVAVPHISLAAARASLGRASVPVLGAQNVFWMPQGAYTGETSPDMLKEFQVTFCLVGHSERRTHVGETDEMVAKKVNALYKQGIQPVICVGETAVQRKKGEAIKIVRQQLLQALSHIKGEEGSLLLIAYEPVWAVGSKKFCSSQDAREVHESIRETLQKTFGKTGSQIRILYGGSVDARNVAEFMSTTQIDGVLIGGASLDPRGFGLLCRAAFPA